MKVPHTAGDWIARPFDDCQIAIFPKDISKREGLIAIVSIGPGAPAGGEANAAAIVAVPDMLRELEYLSSYLGDSGFDDEDVEVSGADLVDYMGERLRCIRATLAKARGEA